MNLNNFLNQIILIQKSIKNFLSNKKYNLNIKNKKISFLSQPIKNLIYISKTNLINNLNQIKLLQKTFKQIQKNTHQTLKKNPIFNTNFISKTTKKKILFFQKSSNSFLTKKIYLKKKHPPKLYFINLLSLHITKNVQQLIFYKLKNNIFPTFSFPFYIKTLSNTLKFLLNFTEKNGKKIFNLFQKIFPNFQQKNSLKIISSINKTQQNQLISSNIYTSIEPDLINFLNSYSKHYKNIQNENFIKERLKNTNLFNTNIFTLIKFIDIEYENFVNEKYCYKCFITKDSCQCSKKTTENDENEIDFNVIQQFEKTNYIETTVKNEILNRKPRLEECYQDPITNLIDSKNNSISFNFNSNENNVDNNVFYEDEFDFKNDDDEKINKKKNIENIKNILHKEKNYNKNNQVFIKKED